MSHDPHGHRHVFPGHHHPHDHDHDHPHDHDHGDSHRSSHEDTPRDEHGNPHDLEAYLARMESPDRAEWQRPDDVVRWLELAGGAHVADIGAGVGYFSMRLARAVGETGHVFAVDAEPQLLKALTDRLTQHALHNVTPVLGHANDPLLPANSCDLVLMVNVFHHFDNPVDYLRVLSRALRPGGRLANIDFHPGELPVGPSSGHKVDRQQFMEAARTAGFSLVQEHLGLTYQYFLVLQQRG